MHEDADLLRSYAETHSEPAFTELVLRHVDFVYSAALRQVGGDAHLAHDVAQTVFLDVARKAGSLAQHPSLVGWLYTSASYAAANAVRAERRRRAREEHSAMMADPSATASSAAHPHAPTFGSMPDWEQVQPLLDSALRELDATDREAVLLRFFANRSFPDIGRALRVSHEAARKRVERALEKLHASLVRRGLTGTTAALATTLSANALRAAPATLAPELARTVLAAAAASTTGTGATTGLASLLFMSKLKTGLALAVVAALTALWFAERSQLTALQAEIATLETSRREIAAKTTAANQQANRTRTALDARAGIAALKPAPLPPLATESLARDRANLDADYAPLFRQLRLNPADLATLKDLLAQRGLQVWQARQFVGAAVGRWMDEWANKTEENEYLATSVRDLDAQILSLLGTEKFATFELYWKTLPWRKPFTELAEQLDPLEPLTDAQVSQLAAWAAESNPDLFTSATRGGPKVPAPVVERAAFLLSPLQLEKLRQIKAANDAWRQMQLYQPPADPASAAAAKPARP